MMVSYFFDGLKPLWDNIYGKLCLGFLSGGASYGSTIEQISEAIGPTAKLIVMVFGAAGAILAVCNAGYDFYKKVKTH